MPPFPPVDSDHESFDRAMDDLAVDDPYDTSWEPVYGLNHVAVTAATQASDTLIAGSYPVAAAEPELSSLAQRRTGLSDL